MIDVNTSLQTAYISAFSSLSYNTVDVKTFYQNAPDNIPDNVYVVLSPVVSVGNSDKTFSQTATTMQVSIISFNEKYNDGLAVNDVAGQVFTAILPTVDAKLTLSAGINTQIELVSDNTVQYKLQNQRNYITRILVFRHQILHN